MSTGNPNLRIRIDADSTAAVENLHRVRAGVADVGSAAEESTEDVDGLGAGLTKLGAGIAAGTALAAMVPALLAAGMAAQDLRTRLVFAAGSEEEADIVMRELSATAVALGQSTNDLTDTYIRLKNLGLNPTRDALTAYANIAAASGKTTIDFAEAVADATTGEFERLKEFGIKAGVEGDQVALRFKGQTNIIANDARSLETALIRIGAVDFAGAAAASADNASTAVGRLTGSILALMGVISDETGLTAGTASWANRLSALAGALSASEANAADGLIKLEQRSRPVATALAGVVDGLTRWVLEAKGLTVGDQALADATQRVGEANNGAAAAAAARTEQQRMLAEQIADMTGDEASLAEAIQRRAEAAAGRANSETEAMARQTAAGAARLSQEAKRDQLALHAAQTAAAGAAARAAANQQDRGLADAAIAAHRALEQREVLNDQRAIRRAQEQRQYAAEDAARLTRYAQLLEESKAKTGDLERARTAAAKAEIVVDQADLAVEAAQLDAVTNAAQRATAALNGVAGARAAYKDARQQQTVKDQNPVDAAIFKASEAASALSAKKPEEAIKAIADAYKLLTAAVSAGAASGGIDVLGAQLDALYNDAVKARDELAEVAVPTPAAGSDPGYASTAAAAGAARANSAPGAPDSTKATKKRGPDAGAADARQQVEQVFSKPIPLTFDVRAGAIAAGQDVVAAITQALAGASFSVPVRAIVTVDSGGATQTSGDPSFTKPAAKFGGRIG